MITLEQVNEQNWRYDLKVSENQKSFVANKTVMLARAYAFLNRRSHAYFIMNDTVPVGMALYYDCEDYQAYDFSQLFIDERYQSKGYGKEATRLILDEMKKDAKYNKCILCYIEGNDVARNMYLSLGFKLTGEADEDEIIMEKIL